MKKRCQVVMLPTNEKAPIWKNINNEIRLTHPNRICPGNVKYQHLYILSNDEIKEGDWYYIFGNRPQLCQKKEENRLFSNFDNEINGAELSWYLEFREKPIKHRHCFKIIATTDTSLTTISRETIESQDLAEELYQLPRPSNEFIKKYCEKGGIDLIEVACDNIRNTVTGGVYDLKIKVAPDNTITIYPIEETFSKEEVLSLFHQFVHEVAQNQASLQFLYKVKEEWLKNHI